MKTKSISYVYPIELVLTRGHLGVRHDGIGVFLAAGALTEPGSKLASKLGTQVLKLLLAAQKSFPQGQKKKEIAGLPYMKPKEAARLLGVSDMQIRRMCDSGELKYQLTPGGHRRILKKQPCFSEN